MKIAVIGAGIIGRTLAGRLVSSGHAVVVALRSPAGASAEAARAELDASVSIEPIPGAIATADAVIVAIPGDRIPDLIRDHGPALSGKLVIDATNDLSGGGSSPLHHCAEWAERAPGAIVARAFCSIGQENFADPIFGDVAATLFWCGPDGEAGAAVEAIIRAVGLEPQRIGGLDTSDLLDGVTRLWFQLAYAQGLGRHLAFRLLRRPG